MLPAVSYWDVRHWQRWGAKLPGQRSLILQDGSESVSRRCDCQPHGGREQGLDGMVNPGEPLINAVMYSKPKRLRGLDQKGRWSSPGIPNFPGADGAPPAERRDLPHPGIPTERGKPVVVPLGRWLGRATDATADQGRGRKQKPRCHGVERGCWSPHAQAGRLPSGLSARESLANCLRRQSR